jgi:2-polyprenyl-6-methoxyphenol hydroxylase-like FAD-dependent oxidoreductase
MPQRRAPRRALIVGGWMSDLLAGMMPARRGWEVDIFERVAGELAGRGAGIVAQPELIARLTALGLDVRDLGVAITTRQILDAAGGAVATRPCPQVLTAWEPSTEYSAMRSRRTAITAAAAFMHSSRAAAA